MIVSPQSTAGNGVIMELYHGSHNGTTEIHEGMCFTDDRDSARCYAKGNIVLVIEVDEDALSTVTCGGYDHDTNDAPADSADFRASLKCDIAQYDDEDEQGTEHECYRICSDVAVEAFSKDVRVMQADDFAEEFGCW